jgi:2-methylcitrate dehydratase PrpD
MADHLTEILARHVARRTDDEIPGAARRATRRLLLDTLAVGWAGSAAEGLAAVRRGLACGPGGECAVWGTGERAGVLDATFSNGVAAAALEFDSLHDAGLVHSDLVCVPAVLAVAQQRKSSGRELVTALALANDVACRLALGAQEHTGWWHSSLYGVFGAAAGCARLLGLDERGVSHALGFALGHAGGTQQAIVEQCGLKRVQSAIAARSGAFSAMLASWGVTAPQEPLLGRHGLYARFERGGADGVVLDGLGQRYEGASSSYKKFPTCGCGHAALEAALQLAHALDLRPEHVEKAVVRISPYMNDIVGAPYEPRDNPTVSAQFSVRYGVACAVLRRRIGLAEIEPSAALDPAPRALASRIEVEVDAANTGKLAPAEVVLTLRDGRVARRTVEAVPGTPANPMSDAELDAKAHECLARGVRPMARAQAEAFIAAVLDIEACADVSRVEGL